MVYALILVNLVLGALSKILRIRAMRKKVESRR